MRFVRYPQRTSLTAPSVVTIGNFDGVHLGHQSLIQEVLTVAEAQSLQSVVVTMNPYPQRFFGHNETFFRLTSCKQQYHLLKSAGIDCLCVLNFNRAMASMTPQSFFEEILLHGLQAAHIIIGDDFRFGQNRSGDFHVLNALAEQHGITVQRMPSFLVNGVRVSSSEIRARLHAGELPAANRYLGRVYGLEGRVLHGKKLGRTLGYPTLNIAVNDDLRLRGIFIVSVLLDGELQTGVANIGTNPTVAETPGLRYQLSAAILEIHLFDFDRDIYGRRVQVLFHKKIRNEVKFDTLAALKAAMLADEKAARQYFESKDFESL